MKKEINNLEFWNSVEKTDPSHTKKANVGGRSLTAINAQQQIKNATEKWGMYGKAWGLQEIELAYHKELVENQILVVSQAKFFYPEGKFEIGSSIFMQVYYKSAKYLKVDDYFLKKLVTDMLTKSLSKLVFNADVFMGRYDDNKYMEKIKMEFEAEKHKKLLPKITDANFKKALKGTEQQVKNVLTQWSLTKEQAEELTDVLSALQSEEPTEQKEEAKPEEKTTTKNAKALKEGSKDWEKVVEYINAGQLTELSQLDDKFTIAKKLQTKIQDLIDNPQKPKAEVKETTQRIPAIPVKLYKEALEMEALAIIPILEKYRMSQTQRDVLTELTKQ